jgi:hypothetical protein
MNFPNMQNNQFTAKLTNREVLPVVQNGVTTGAYELDTYTKQNGTTFTVPVAQPINADYYDGLIAQENAKSTLALENVAKFEALKASTVAILATVTPAS